MGNCFWCYTTTKEEDAQEVKKEEEEMNVTVSVLMHLMRQREESVLETDSLDDTPEETFTMVDVDTNLDNDHYDDHTTFTLPQDDEDDNSLSNKACYYCNDNSTISCDHCERPMCSPCFLENGHPDSICGAHACSACVQFNEQMQIYTCPECLGE
eukprot:13137609-Ditylum_brightwellii.AAC.1